MDPIAINNMEDLEDDKDPDQVTDLVEQLKARRADLRDGELPTWREQHQKAMTVVKIVAIRHKARF